MSEFVRCEELRIGNYIFNLGEYIKVLAVDPLGINRKDDDQIFECRSYDFTFPMAVGIPFTAEILQAFGFNAIQLIGNVVYFKIMVQPKFTFEIYFSPGGRQIFFNNNEDKMRFNKIRYFHQFQNLVYALTEADLELKEIELTLEGHG